MRRSKLSDKEKRDNIEEKAAILSNFESTALSGKVSHLRSRLESRIDDAVKELETDLQKKESIQAALKWGKSTEVQAALDEQAIDAFVCHRLEKAVAGHPLTKELDRVSYCTHCLERKREPYCFCLGLYVGGLHCER